MKESTKAMAVKTKCIGQPMVEDDGYRILITRFYPRGVARNRFHEWAYTLAPSRELLLSYKEGKLDWASFAGGFLSQLKTEPGCAEAIQTLHELSRTDDITLLCHEREGTPCHRHLVRDLVEDPGLLSR